MRSKLFILLFTIALTSCSIEATVEEVDVVKTSTKDSDGDGVVDELDQELFSRSGVEVDSYGVEIPYKEAPQNFQIDPEIYGLNLSWDIVNDPRLDSIIIYKGVSENSLDKFVSVSAKEGNHVDRLVGVRENYYYKIQFLAGSTMSAFSQTLSESPIEPLNDKTPVANEIGGIHYAYWDFRQETFEELSHQFTIYELPSNIDGSGNNDGLYYQFYQGVINDTIGFYYGIQTRLYKPGVGTQYGLIFSRWKTRDTLNFNIAENGWGESAGYEGDFIGVRKHFDWGVGSYETIIRKDSVDDVGDWYSLKIKDLESDESSYIGSLRFERSSESSGIKTGGITWTELYSKSPLGTPLPNWRVSVDQVRAEGEKPFRVYITYNETRFVDFYNTYTTNNENLFFLMGPKVKKTNNKGYLWEE